MGKRARNPRVVAVEILADLKRTADAMRSRWTYMATRTVYEQESQTRTVDYGRGKGPEEVRFLNTVTRPRRAEEYPEAQESEWSRMWGMADDMERQAAALKALALAEWQKFGNNAQYTLYRKESGR